MKIIAFILITAIIPTAYAGGNHHNTVINEYNTYNQYVTNEGMALAMAAANINMYWGSSETQIAVSGGYMDSESAGMIAIGKRFCGSCPLLQGTLGRYNGETGLGIGATWLLK